MNDQPAETSAQIDAISEISEISKKDVLRETGISYGQFYRWKRMGIIPEQWFHRRSTFTGQEAFLPRRKVLARIARVLSLKDEYSLEQIAEMLSPTAARTSFTPAEVAAMDLASPAARELFGAQGSPHEYDFGEIVCLAAIDRLLSAGLGREEVRLAGETLGQHYDKIESAGEARTLTVLSCGGQTAVVLHGGTFLTDANTRTLAQVDLNQLIVNIKVRLSSSAANERFAHGNQASE